MKTETRRGGALRKLTSKALAVLTSLALALALVPTAAATALADEVEDAGSAALKALTSDTVTATGTSGTVTWTLYDDGELVLAPTSGDKGTLASFSGIYDGVPWSEYREDILSVIVDGTVVCGSRLDYMFADCRSLKSLDLSGLDTSGVTSMAYMFFSCSSLTSLDLSSFDTSSVLYMRSMFQQCSSLTSLDLSSFDTSSVLYMDYMFYRCLLLENLNLTSFDTSSVTLMSYMFYNCSSLKSLDLSSFDTSSTEYARYVFYNCSTLVTIYASESRSFCGVATYGTYMFTNCTSLVGGNGTAYSSGHTSNTYARIDTDDEPGYFTYKAYEGSDASGDSDSASASSGTCGTVAWTLSDDGELFLAPASGSSGTLAIMSSTDDVPWYGRCGDIVSATVSGTVYGGSGLAYLFYDCSSLEALDLSGLDTSSVTSMACLFYGCSSLETLDLSGLDTSSVIDMSGMFCRCSSLVTIYVSDLWSTESVTESEDMFYRCYSIVGGNGTVYDSDYTDCTYARIGTSDTPGYLTDISDTVTMDASSLFSSTLYRAAYLLDDSNGAGSVVADDIALVLDGTTPAQKLLASACENGLADAATVWEWVTGIGDGVSSASSVADLAVEPYEVYATLIVCILEDSSDENVSVPAIAKDATSLADELVGQALDSVDSGLGEAMDTLVLSDALSSEQREQLEKYIESMLKNSSALDATSSLLSAVSKCFDVVDTASELADCVSACVTLANTSGYLLDVLREARSSSASGDDAYLTAALDSCISAMDASTDELYENIATGAFCVVGTTVAEKLLDKLWDGAWTALSAACPAVAVLKTVYKASKLVTNSLFNTDGITEQYSRMEALSSIESVFGTTYSQLLWEAEVLSDSEQAAGLYLASVDLMFMTIDQDCEEAAAFVEEVDSATVSKIAQWLGFDDNSAYLAQISGIQTGCYNVWQTSVLTNWISQLEQDYPDLYDEYSSLIEEAQNRMATKEYLVACPVDVYVYDASGVLVASCVDGKASCSDDANLTLVLDGDEKTVVFYDDAEYTIECVGTDTGTMDVTATEYDDEGTAARTVSWYGLALAEGTTYTAAVDSETLSEDGCTLVDEEGEAVEADYDSLTADSTAYAFEVVNGVATVAGEPCLSGTAQAGQSVQVTAYVPEGYEFVGWEVTSGADVTFADATATTTTFAMPAGDVQVTAVLQVKEAAVTDISSATVKLSKTSYTYNGKTKKPGVTVKLNGTTLTKGTDYTVKYSNNTKAGTAKVTITGKGSYTGTVKKTFKIKKGTQSLKAKGKTVTVKGKTKKGKLKKKVVLARTKALKVTGAKTAVTYTKVSGNKKITINSKTGKITLKKGLKKGTYKVKVKVQAKATSNYKASKAKTVMVTIKVK